MSNTRVATLALVALLMSALLAACTQPGSSDLQPGATDGTFALDVLVHGGGQVVIDDLDFVCSDDCTARIGSGVTVELRAQAGADGGFAGWQGACSGTGTCTVTMDGDKSVAAIFAENVLVLDMQGDGQASVRVEPGDDCTGDCVRAYTTPVDVSLSVNPDGNSEAAGFGGACSDSEHDDFCVVTVQGRVDVAAIVNIRRFTLTVNRSGSGSVSGTGIDCPDDCSTEVRMGDSVALTAQAADGWEFDQWEGADCGGSTSCTVQVNADEEVTAVFRERFLLGTTVAGDGSGTITSSPDGINCGSDCQERYSPGRQITLTAQPSPDSLFAGWSGDHCDGSTNTTCTFPMNAPANVTATFEPQPITVEHDLTLTLAGQGSGSIHIDPINETCNSDCTKQIEEGTPVTLTATEDQDSLFVGWSGACTGTGSCTFTMDSNKSVTATFEQLPPPEPITLNVDLQGEGSGSVSGNGIACEPDCDETYSSATNVTLTATAASDGSTFSNWGGACSGTDPECTVEVSSATNVTATFDPPPEPEQFALTVEPTGDGSGQVSGQGIECPGDCRNDYDEMTQVTLSAQPDEGSTFEGWNDGCEGDDPSCTVTMDGDKTVAAQFGLEEIEHLLQVSLNGDGTVSSTPSGIACPGDCNENYQDGTGVTLAAAPGSGSQFESWDGCDSEVDGDCSVTMGAARTVTATFSPLEATFTLDLQVSGTGSVAVEPSVFGTCSDSCSEDYEEGAMVKLTAQPDSNETVTWDGACSTATGDICDLQMDSDKNVGVTFGVSEDDGASDQAAS